MTSLKRLGKELKDMEQDPPIGISAGPIDEANMYKWQATIIGPGGSPYEGGIFKLQIDFPKEYPFKSPQVKFLTKVFHPNINPNNGNICMTSLGNDYTPALTISRLLLSISSLLTDANPKDPLNANAAKLLLESPKEYDKQVKSWVTKYAVDGQAPVSQYDESE